MGTTHRVTQGECLSSIAARYGFADYRAIYDHPDNAEFKKKRPNPNVIHPGDAIVIPDKDPKSVDRPTGERHRFKAMRPKTMLRLRLADDDDNPYAGKKYRLTVDGRKFEGKTGGDGLLEREIPPDAVEGELVLFLSDEDGVEGLVLPLELGHLDPSDQVSGAQARLLNLGYDCGGVTGSLDDATKEAVEAFQSRNGLPVTGALDDATSDKLRQLHEE